MKLPRPSRFIAAAITLFSILFMQLAVAAYVCPALAIGHAQQVPASVSAQMGDMASCEEVDPDQPSLCHAHDQVGNQSLDKPPVPLLQPFLAIGFWQPLASLDPPHRPADTSLAPSLTHAIAPPLAIRHCCFRI